MTTPSENKSHLEQFYLKFMQEDLAKIINECVYIVSNQDPIKISLNVKIVVALNFMCSIFKIIHVKY